MRCRPLPKPPLVRRNINWVAAPLLALLLGCSTESNDGRLDATSEDPTGEPIRIHFNQLGFATAGPKIAVVAGADDESEFLLIDENNQPAYRGSLSSSKAYPPAGQQVRQARFDDLTDPGEYRLRVGRAISAPVIVGSGGYGPLHDAALKVFYLTRASDQIEARFAGPYARGVGHPDTEVLIHESAVGPQRQAGDRISAPGGWYDAGDYNKYVVNSGITTYTLLAAYEHFSDFYQQRQINIPESGNALPDILDEVAVNLRWLQAMQDPSDGGVYHKLTTLNFSGFIPPDEDRATRYVVAKSTAAALDFAAVMAVAARVYAQFEGTADQAKAYRSAAESAWRWAKQNPLVLYEQPDDVKTGTYAPSDEDLVDEFAWAAAELFLLTSDAIYLEEYLVSPPAAGVPSWDWVAPLAWVSLAHHSSQVPQLKDEIEEAVLQVSDQLVAARERSAYSVAVNAFEDNHMIGKQERSFEWGSNGHVANQGLMLVQAYRLTGDKAYLETAAANMDWLLGRNPIGISFVTGFGTRAAGNLHHRVSVTSGAAVQVPGMLAGGPNQSQQDRDDCLREGVQYPSTLPALSYVDEVCSYASNEMAINWNAPLVYLSAALESLAAR